MVRRTRHRWTHPVAALPFVHGTRDTARLLEKHKLWKEGTACWHIVNYAERQRTEAITEAIHEARRLASEKANCTRWHGPKCWQLGRCQKLTDTA